MRKTLKQNSTRQVRHFAIRGKVRGTAERLRLSVYPSSKHFEAQFINDFEQKTVMGFTTKSKEFRGEARLKSFGNIEAAVKFGKYVALKAREKGIQKAVFDRGGFLYHGRVKAFADAAREGGLSF
jgi:large subunit ribosomal protein L18